MGKFSDSNLTLLHELIDKHIWVPPGSSAFEWVMTLLPNFASPNPELHDILTYRIVTEIIAANMLSTAEISALLDTILGDWRKRHRQRVSSELQRPDRRFYHG